MTTLSIDCAGPLLSFACETASGARVARCIRAQQSHDEKFSVVLGEVLSEAGATLCSVTKIIVGGGPGSFTGIRIALSFAKGLAWANKCPLWVILSPIGTAWRYRTDAESVVVVSPAGTGLLFITEISGPRWPAVLTPPFIHRIGDLGDTAFYALHSAQSAYWVSTGEPDQELPPSAVSDSEGAAIGFCEIFSDASPVDSFGVRHASSAIEISETEPFYVRSAEARSLQDRGIKAPQRLV